VPFDHPVYVLKADFFRILGHPARVRILELLRDGERTVGDLQAELGLDSSGTSQHLGALRKQGLLDSRRERTSVYYRVRDPRTFQLLKVARQVLSSNLAETRDLLDGLSEAPGAKPKRVRPRSKT
jgi:DNA-binding transcriptional ArsR family regulator